MLPQGCRSLYESLVESAFQTHRLAPPTSALSDYRSSLQRFLKQHAPFLGRSRLSENPESAETLGIVRWLAWCTLEACERPRLTEDARQVIRTQYMELFDDIIVLCRHNMLAPQFGLSETTASTIDEKLTASRQQFERQLRALQEDFLYPGLKEPLTEKVRSYVLRDFGRPSFYPPYEEPEDLMILRQELYLRRVSAFIDRLPRWVLGSALIKTVHPKFSRPQWWGELLSNISTVDGYWPCLVSLRPAVGPSSQPATRSASE